MQIKVGHTGIIRTVAKWVTYSLLGRSYVIEAEMKDGERGGTVQIIVTRRELEKILQQIDRIDRTGNIAA